MDKKEHQEDLEPVCYCKNCLSLAVIYIGDAENNILCCRDCGDMDVDFAYITDWESMYKNKYGYNFLNKNKNGRTED